MNDPDNLVLLGRTLHEGRMQQNQIKQIHALALGALEDSGPEALGDKAEALAQIRDLSDLRGGA